MGNNVPQRERVNPVVSKVLRIRQSFTCHGGGFREILISATPILASGDHPDDI